MSRLAGLINKEKNRRIVSEMFSSDETSTPEKESDASPLCDQLITLERVIFEEGAVIDKTRSEVLISELEAIASEL